MPHFDRRHLRVPLDRLSGVHKAGPVAGGLDILRGAEDGVIVGVAVLREQRGVDKRDAVGCLDPPRLE